MGGATNARPRGVSLNTTQLTTGAAMDVSHSARSVGRIFGQRHGYRSTGYYGKDGPGRRADQSVGAVKTTLKRGNRSRRRCYVATRQEIREAFLDLRAAVFEVLAPITDPILSALTRLIKWAI